MSKECNVALCVSHCFAIYHQDRDLNHIERYFAEVHLNYFSLRILSKSVWFNFLIPCTTSVIVVLFDIFKQQNFLTINFWHFY